MFAGPEKTTVMATVTTHEDEGGRGGARQGTHMPNGMLKRGGKLPEIVDVQAEIVLTPGESSK